MLENPKPIMIYTCLFFIFYLFCIITVYTFSFPLTLIGINTSLIVLIRKKLFEEYDLFSFVHGITKLLTFFLRREYEVNVGKKNAAKVYK